MTLARVVSANTTTTNLQPNVFVFNTIVSGRLFDDRNGNGRFDAASERGIDRAMISLVDETGTTIVTTPVGMDGTYRFEGVQLGNYTVRPLLDHIAGMAIDVTRGQVFAGIDFGVRPIAMPPQRVLTAPHNRDRRPRRGDSLSLLA